jgi:hypothetical protein
MATGTAGSAARQFHTQQVHYLRKTITYANNGQTVNVGTIPAGSVIVGPITGAIVTTAFAGGTAYTLDMGYSTDSGIDNLMTAVSLGTAGFKGIDETGALLTSVDTIISAELTSDATSGSAEVVVAYIPDNDG